LNEVAEGVTLRAQSRIQRLGELTPQAPLSAAIGVA
jgi:hypothetical protein